MDPSSQVLRPRHHPGLPLGELGVPGSGVLTGVAVDSRLVQPGDLYVALAGATTHGARFVTAAAQRGALAVLTDPGGAALAAEAGLPVAVVPDPRAAMAGVAARVYGHPTRRLVLFGVTGTNGKTSTVFLLEAALAALGHTVATIGTIGYRVGGRALDVPRTTITTPESPDLQALLAAMVEEGADSVAMEVSSHALALHRTDGLGFDVAGFTMLGQDHLDFHGTLEDYFAAKTQLFLGGSCRQAVVNVDDPWGRRLADLVRADGRPRLVTTAVDADADYRVVAHERQGDGSSRVQVRHPGGEVGFTISMLGDFNVRNAVTALAMVGAQGLDVARAATGFASAHVPGRMQRLQLGSGAPHVVVDFAHTPQAVAEAVRALPPGGRRVVVLGAGGDRDATKRAGMGAAAAAHADVVVVTDDNPRSERPEAIRAAVLAGARSVGGAEVLDGGDRRSAIALALQLAGPSDWVAVLGKGHEPGQEAGGVVTPFDDVEVVTGLWEEGR